MAVGCPCPPVHNDIVTPRHLFKIHLFAVVFSDEFHHFLLRSSGVPKRRAPTEETSVLPWALFCGETTKERVMLDALLPKAFALIAIFEMKLDQVFARVAVGFWMNLEIERIQD